MLDAPPPGQDVEGNRQNVIGFVIGEMDLEQMEIMSSMLPIKPVRWPP